mgnify:CR=1 FL=1
MINMRPNVPITVKSPFKYPNLQNKNPMIMVSEVRMRSHQEFLEDCYTFQRLSL